MTKQQIALVGGYPDGVWTCAWCAAELTDQGFAHKDDCRFIADVRAQGAAAERERIRQLVTPQLLAMLVGQHAVSPDWAAAVGDLLETRTVNAATAWAEMTRVSRNPDPTVEENP